MKLTYLSALLADAAPGLANHLWQSTIFALAAGILTLALRQNQAGIRYRLWLAASLKFLIPFSLLIHFGMRVGSHLSVAPENVIATAMHEFGQPFVFFVTVTGHTMTHASFFFIFGGSVWLCGTMVVLGRWWIHWQRVAAAMRAASPATHGREVSALRRIEQSCGTSDPISFFLSPNALEPGIFGIGRPALLWPATLSAQLTDSQLEAIVAHELAHVRRRDNLVAAIHMAVEALFWFHPLVWWIGARLVEERERACDEEVVRLGNAPQAYAESILKTCAFCVSTPLDYISGVTGADLKKRVVRIMTNRSVETLSAGRKVLLLSAVVVAFALPVVCGLLNEPVARAQSAQTNAGATAGITAQGDLNQEKVYRVGGDVSAPRLTFAPDPQYSEEARIARYQGVCVLSLVVNAKGKVERVQVQRHLGMGLDQKAVEAVQQYTFKPARRFGKPVAVVVNVEVNFKRD